MENNYNTYEELIQKLKTYLKEEDFNLIDECYKFASKCHMNQKRITGEEYIYHPISVAYILAGIGADKETICAALLHDTIEDCGITKEEMEEMFGFEITNIVYGVTKINKLSFNDESEAMIANHRKIIVGLAEDVRVIILKLADRLNNLRTLWALPEEKQKKKAKETLKILTPIADRLGMNKIKTEMEDLAFRYLKPDLYFDIIEKLNQTKSERDGLVIEMQEKIIELLNEHGIKHEIKGRAKSIYSIYRKLEKGRRWSDIYDIYALRVFVDTEQECYQTLGLIHSKYKPIPKRFKDYVAMPKTNMYQSLHTTVFGINGTPFEIQIRTYDMDKVAESGIASHWSYKERGSVKANLQNTMEQKLQFFKAIMELQQENLSKEEFVSSALNDVFNDTIYVFTPAGDVIELPVGSTPIDFAYKVHSNVGNHMVSAIVNGNIQTLDTPLKDNDIVRIQTSNNAKPSKEWLKIAKTTQAKQKIKDYFKRLAKDGFYKKGQEIIAKEIKRKKITNSEFFKDENIDKILKALKLNSIDELYVNLGDNKIGINQIFNILFEENLSKEELILKKTNDQKVILNYKDLYVEGIENMKINVAGCCNPVPGDKIIGYVTKGNGVTVHRFVCPNISEEENRIINVNWSENSTSKYETLLLIHAIDNKDTLMDIITKASNRDITITSMNNVFNDNLYYIEIKVLVKDLDTLNIFINDLNQLSEIVDVERVIK